MKKYDYLIVGAGLFGATFAHDSLSSTDHVSYNALITKLIIH